MGCRQKKSGRSPSIHTGRGLFWPGRAAQGSGAARMKGASWSQISAGLPPESTIYSIVFDPAQAGVIYAADRLFGVYASQDSGETWSKSNGGLKMRAVNELAISNDGQHLYAATEGNGVYRLDLNGTEPQAVNIPIPDTQAAATRAAATQPPGTAAETQAGEASNTLLTSAGWPVYAGILTAAGVAGLLIFIRRK